MSAHSMKYDLQAAKLRVEGTTVPADASVGYPKGAIFIDTDAAVGSQYYVNEGTEASSDFNVAL